MKGMMFKDLKDGSSIQILIDWMLFKVLSFERYIYKSFFLVIIKLVDVIYSVFIINVWFERGLGVFTRIKIKFRNRFGQEMLKVYL